MESTVGQLSLAVSQQPLLPYTHRVRQCQPLPRNLKATTGHSAITAPDIAVIASKAPPSIWMQSTSTGWLATLTSPTERCAKGTSKAKTLSTPDRTVPASFWIIQNCSSAVPFTWPGRASVGTSPMETPAHTSTARICLLKHRAESKQTC